MKKVIINSLILLAIVVSGCKKEENPDNVKKTPVTFKIEDPATKIVSDGTYTTFDEGDIIGITSSGLDAVMSNAEYTVAADGSLTGEVFYYNGSSSATFYAHYPYTAEYKNGKVTMKVEADQSSKEGYYASDFMTATSTGDPATGGTVTLRMSHRLTLVKIIWNGSHTATDATLNDVRTTVTWNHADNSLQNGETISDVLTWKVAEDRQEYWAVIPAQTITEGTTLLTINDTDHFYKYVTVNDVTFNPNTIKRITLDVKANNAVEAKFSEIAIDNWISDDLVCEGEVDIYDAPPVELISVEGGQYIELTPNSKANAEAGKWNVAVNNQNVIEWDETEKAIHLNIKSNLVENGVDENGEPKYKETSTWWDNAVYYRPDAKVASKIRPRWYKLSFEVKASQVDKGFMVQVLKGDESGNIYFGIINSDPTGKDEITYQRMYYPVLKTTEEYVTVNYWVNFGAIVSTDGKTVTEGKIGDYEKVLFMISINTGTTDANAYGVDFHFKNFTFIEIKPE